MTQAAQPPEHGPPGPSRSVTIPPRTGAKLPFRTSALPHFSDHATTTYVHNGHLNLDTFSPVSQNGSFAFDRVLKSGTVQKRTRKTKKWKSVFLVLRPNLLSIYRNEKEDRLRKQLNPSELTAVAYLKVPKRQYVFGLFSPSRNYHLEASSESEAREWIDLIRREARIEEEEEEMYLASPGGNNSLYQGFERPGAPGVRPQPHQPDSEPRIGSSSPEPSDLPHASRTRDGIRIPAVHPSGRISQSLDYSGNELGSYSDFSDAPDGVLGSSWSIPQPNPTVDDSHPAPPTRPTRQLYALGAASDDERVIWHAYLYVLHSSRSLRQWKLLWAVLRPKNLAFYKNEDEYAVTLLIPLTSIIDVVEIDPLSRSKTHCMQIIAEEKSWRVCAMDEEGLAKWLGAMKSVLIRRKEEERRAGGTAVAAVA